MDRRFHIACIAVAPLLLGGCTLFHKLGLGHPRAVQQAARGGEPTAPDNAATYTASGRTQLDSGNVGLAIEAFQQALGRGEPQAPALNGLAVAYARLGRAEIAEQLFRQAIAEDPANEKYPANLALLEQSQQAIDAAAPVLTAQAAPPAAASALPPRTRWRPRSPRSKANWSRSPRANSPSARSAPNRLRPAPPGRCRPGSVRS